MTWHPEDHPRLQPRDLVHDLPAAMLAAAVILVLLIVVSLLGPEPAAAGRHRIRGHATVEATCRGTLIRWTWVRGRIVGWEVARADGSLFDAYIAEVDEGRAGVDISPAPPGRYVLRWDDEYPVAGAHREVRFRGVRCPVPVERGR